VAQVVEHLTSKHLALGQSQVHTFLRKLKSVGLGVPWLERQMSQDPQLLLVMVLSETHSPHIISLATHGSARNLS
jgi:hypothetical protein